MNYLSLFKKCELCPRRCHTDRTTPGSEKKAFCGQGHELRVSYIGPHHGEEPPVSGINGSGTVFFSGCSLRCSFCQNHQISMEGAGGIITPEDFYSRVAGMIEKYGVHNINFVTPDHFFPHTFSLVRKLRENGFKTPVLYNISGYQSLELLKTAEDYADIYLPDYKYSDSGLSFRYSKCRDYPERALDAVSEMVRQKGFLDSFLNEKGIASRGVLVRHLILPGKVENSIGVLDSLFLEFGKRLPLSLMSQYHPVKRHEDNDMNRRITDDEFDAVYCHALELGFENMFVQFPEGYDIAGEENPEFLPDFNRKSPFKGNRNS